MSEAKPEMEIPTDFPRTPPTPAVSGAQPKLVLRELDGRYMDTLTEQQHRNRYLYCTDLVEQLIAYAERKRVEKPLISLVSQLDSMDASLRLKDWKLSKAENDWIMVKVRGHFVGEVRATLPGSARRKS